MLILRRSAQPDAAIGFPPLSALIPRFSLVAPISINLLVATGLVNAVIEVQTLDARIVTRRLTNHATPGVHTDGQLFLWITNGYPNLAMPAFGKYLADTDRWNLVNFIRTLAAPQP